MSFANFPHWITAVVEAAHELGYAVVSFDGRKVTLTRDTDVRVVIEGEVTPDLLREILRGRDDAA